MQKNKIIGVLVVTIVTLLLCVGCDKKNNVTNSDANNLENNSNSDSNVSASDNNTGDSNGTTSTAMSFDDYSKILENKDIEEIINTENDYNAVLEVYLKNGEVYFYFKDAVDLKNMGLSDSDITKVKNLQLDANNRYKLPLKDIILMDVKKIGQDGSPLMLFEDKTGKVYSFHGSQTGASSYALFNGNAINIKEESNLKNIVKFGSYATNNSIEVYGIDINGNIIYR